MFKPHLKAWRDAVNIGLQQFMPEFPGRVAGRPWDTGLLIGAHKHPATFLAQIQLAIEIDRMDHFAARFCVDLGHFGHVFGDEIHMLHRQDGQFKAHHAPHFARPKPACIHHMLAGDIALVGLHDPTTIAPTQDARHHAVCLIAGPKNFGGFGIGIGHTRRVKMAIDNGAQSARKLPRIKKRHQLMRLFGGDYFGFNTLIAPFGRDGFQPIKPLRRGGQHHPTCHVKACGLT